MTKGQPAALYLRSSKDRKDVSIDTQRRELQRLAADRGLIVVQEYADVVESGKDEQRAGFQQMIADMKLRDRAWHVLLLLDTSRLARRRLTSILFEERDAKRYGITIIYKNLPELDEAESMLLRSQMQGIDEYHSLVSKRKGLAGMAENVRQGFRAGGRAPRGYRLKHVPTGVVREGEQVAKSVLEPSADAPLVARYLKARAAGRSRVALEREMGITWPRTTAVGMERNALTYAGHTVWNVHNEFERGRGYKNRKKQRPRHEWVIQKNTHPALITDAEAEALLEQLEGNRHKPYRTSAAYLLTGLLKTPAGEAWHGNGAGRYRMKRNRCNVPQSALETAVLDQVAKHLRSTAFARHLTAEAQRHAAAYRDDPAAARRSELRELVTRISKMMDLAAQMAEPGPALRKIEELERQRKAMEGELLQAGAAYRAAAAARALTEERVTALLAAAAEDMKTMDREKLKDRLASLVERITLDPDSLDCQIHYRIAARESGASPREGAEIPILRLIRTLRRVA